MQAAPRHPLIARARRLARRGLDAVARRRALAGLGEHRNLVDQCVRFAVPVTQPLVLISQVQRSGGTLLSQLFDGHIQVHAHPHELKIGKPAKSDWPAFDANDDADALFADLFEMPTLRLFAEGYRKSRRNDDAFRFLLAPSIQREVFRHTLQAADRRDARAVLDAYMTAYFNAWLDNANLRGDKRIVSAFVARLALKERSVAGFFEAYPDGRLISVLRSAEDWFASAQGHMATAEYTDLDEAIALWRRAAEAIRHNRQAYGDRTLVLAFEDLVGDTPATMRRVASFAGIDFDPILAVPTFNRQPIKANSSFAVAAAGIDAGALDRAATLPEAQRARIKAETGDLYQEIRALCAG